MLIADILREKGAQVEIVTAETPLKDAIRILADRRIGVLVVSSDGRNIDGILSERDIVRGLAGDAVEFAGYMVGDLMTVEVHTCAPDSTVAEIMGMMDERHIRHVPVAVEGVLAGVVSIRDIISAMLKEAEMERREMAGYITGSPLI